MSKKYGYPAEDRLEELRAEFAAYRADVEMVLRVLHGFRERIKHVQVGVWTCTASANELRVLAATIDETKVCREAVAASTECQRIAKEGK